MKQIVYIILLCLLAPVVYAKKMAPRANFKLIEAYTQKTLPADPHAPPPTGEHFIIVWQTDLMPETFYWRGKSGFMMCKTQKVHKIAKKDAKKYPANMSYTADAVGGDVMRGDTLEIIPVARGKVRIPDDIPQDVTNTIFYKITGSNWLLFQVDKISSKKNIVIKKK